jgi:hypothetical protein
MYFVRSSFYNFGILQYIFTPISNLTAPDCKVEIAAFEQPFKIKATNTLPVPTTLYTPCLLLTCVHVVIAMNSWGQNPETTDFLVDDGDTR